MLITRHGGGSHFVRPDRVTRTGVLTSIYGYQPDADVQGVAQSFAYGPPSGTIYASGATTSLSGAGFGGPGLFARIGLRIKAAWNEAKARRMMATGMGGAAPLAPSFTEAQMISPQIATQMQMLARLAPSSGGGPMAAAYTAATRRQNTYYRAG